MSLNDNADHATIAVVDNLLHGILQFHLTFVIDGHNLISHAVGDKVFNGFSKYVG